MSRLTHPIRAVAALAATLATASALADCPPLLDVSVAPIGGGKAMKLCEAYPGKSLLIVNTASRCGYTPQYKGLESLYERYRERGLMVLAFPSNDFNQEPGSAGEIKEFCERRYQVQFPVFEKSHVKGTEASPLFSALAKAAGTPPQWNFHKFLVSADGSRVESFESAVTPDDPKLTGAIERNLH